MENYLAKATVDYKHVKQTFQEFYSFLDHFRIWDLSNPAGINGVFVVGFRFVNYTMTASCKFLINSIFLCIWHIFKNIFTQLHKDF